jgi:SAM-dependent methyltransferase
MQESKKEIESDVIEIDTGKIEGFIGKVLNDFGATGSTPLVLIGDKLGLYKALSDYGPMNSFELAEKTKTVERYVREWLINQAAGGYIEYDPLVMKYNIPPEHAIALTDENSPYFVMGGFQIFTALVKAHNRITELFTTGGGMEWGEHDENLFIGTERFFKPGYIGNLVNSWIPSMNGVREKLERGAKVADIGCGHGASTIIMAKAFPNSKFFGFDKHKPSIDRAREIAEADGLSDRISFEVAGATDFPGSDYDFIAYFDCFHDLCDPEGSSVRSYKTLAKDGTVMIVEPMAGENVEDNFNPVGRVFSAASVMCCTPNAMSCNGKHVLGTVASDKNLKEVVTSSGFTKFRRATETPFNRIFEIRK